MNSCHKAVRLIRGTTLKLCTDCEEKPITIRILHHDNVPAHTLMLVREFLAKNKTVIKPQLPYSPDLAPASIFFLSKLKTPMKGKSFARIEEIKEKSNQ